LTASFATQIEIDASGVPWLAYTKVKVAEVVLDKIACGWSPEEIHFQHPHLSLAQIYAALTFYYENEAELDRQILETLEETAELSQRVSDPELKRKLSEVKRSR
jgi:uncharacterized protein (DUF433 family)